jgi:hypothetical protein
MILNDPKLHYFHGDTRRPRKTFGTNNPKYSFYHIIVRNPAEICFFVRKIHLSGKKLAYLNIFMKATYSFLGQNCSEVIFTILLF